VIKKVILTGNNKTQVIEISGKVFVKNIRVSYSKSLATILRRQTRPMNSIEISEIIKTELQVEPDIKNVFGLDLAKCLVRPTKQKYKSSNDSTEIHELWTVLEETEDGNGYKIYYDEESGLFGLAIRSDKDELIDIGRYGTFLKTLYSM
jgi:hypothetical protein